MSYNPLRDAKDIAMKSGAYRVIGAYEVKPMCKTCHVYGAEWEHEVVYYFVQSLIREGIDMVNINMQYEPKRTPLRYLGFTEYITDCSGTMDFYSLYLHARSGAEVHKYTLSIHCGDGYLVHHFTPSVRTYTLLRSVLLEKTSDSAWCCGFCHHTLTILENDPVYALLASRYSKTSPMRRLPIDIVKLVFRFMC